MEEIEELTEEEKDQEFIRQMTQTCSLESPKIMKHHYDEDNHEYSIQDVQTSKAFFNEGFHIVYERHLSH